MSYYLTTLPEIMNLAYAIKTRTGTSSSLSFPDGFISEINSIQPNPTTSSATITPSETQKSVTAAGYTTFSIVTVNAISNKYVGTGITRHTTYTYTPGTTNQTISSNTYISSTVTIAGDANLAAGNIVSGKSIFGVTGTKLPVSYTGVMNSYISRSQMTNITCTAAFIRPFTFYLQTFSNTTFNNASQIRYNAFNSATFKTPVSFPSCTTLQAQVFLNAVVSQIDLPVCTAIGAGAFSNCQTLSSINIPLCSYVGSSVFYSCYALSQIDIPNCSYVNVNGFRDCTTLSFVSFSLCAYVGSSAFQNCVALKSFRFSACSSIYSTAFFSCTSLSAIYCPSCSIVGQSAFQATDIRTLTWGNLLSAGNYAFRACQNLTSASMTNVVSLGTGIFSSCIKLSVLYAPKCTTLGIHAFNSTIMASLTLGALTALDLTSTFADIKTTLTYFSCATTVTVSMPAYTKLTSVTFTAATSIAGGGFSGCTSLKTLSFPAIKIISANAFNGCTALTTASFPKCTNIGQSAFKGCTKLASLYFASTSYITGATDMFSNVSTTFKIYVPSTMVASYKSRAYWSAYSAKIYSIT